MDIRFTGYKRKTFGHWTYNTQELPIDAKVFTGKFDSHGVGIFEDDLLQWIGAKAQPAEEVPLPDVHRVVWNDEYNWFEIYSYRDGKHIEISQFSAPEEFVVLGNYTDNWELVNYV